MSGDSTDTFGFRAVLLYLFIEYVRPQDIGPLRFIHPGVIGAVLLMIAIASKGGVGTLVKRQLLYLVLFCLLLVVLVPFAKNNFYAYMTARDCILNTICVFGIVLFVNTPSKLRTLLKFMVLIMIYLAIRGTLHKGIAGQSFLQDQNDFSLLINMLLPFSISLFFYHQELKYKLLPLFASLIGVAAVVASESRGGFVGLLCVFFVVWYFSKRKMAMLAIFGLLSVVLLLVGSSKYWARIYTTTNYEQGDAKSRIELWKSACKMFYCNPLGVGGGNYPVRAREYQTSWFQTKVLWGKPAHSLWFTLLSELGVEGIFIYGMFLFYNWKSIIALARQYQEARDDFGRYTHLLAIALIGSSVGYFSSGTFLSVLYYPHYFYLTGIIVVAEKLAALEEQAAGRQEWICYPRSPEGRFPSYCARL